MLQDSTVNQEPSSLYCRQRSRMHLNLLGCTPHACGVLESGCASDCEVIASASSNRRSNMSKKLKVTFRWPIRFSWRWIDRDVRRNFTHTQQVEMLERQDGRCEDCRTKLSLRTVMFHHVIPWHEGGKTVISNGVALCPNCHITRTFEHNLGDAEESRK